MREEYYERRRERSRSPGMKVEREDVPMERGLERGAREVYWERERREEVIVGRDGGEQGAYRVFV